MTTYAPIPPVPTSPYSDHGDEVPPLRYPKPSHDLPRLPEYESDVQRLETQAERMSFGRDVGKEISRLSQELKRNESIKSSMSRTSTIHTNTAEAARRPPFSPTEFIRSPEGSIHTTRSGSSPTRGQRRHSAARVVKPSGLPEPEQEGRPLDSFVSTTPSYSMPVQAQQEIAMVTTWEQPAAEEEEEEEVMDDHKPNHDVDDEFDDDAVNDGENLLDEKEATRRALEGIAEHSRQPSTASRASQSTFRDGSVFRDFDGTHYEASLHNARVQFDRNISRQSSNGRPTQESLRQSHQKWAEPPPSDSMVYYPAPVPMHLNLPKRLSQQVPLDMQAQRRSQFMPKITEEHRRSVMWPQQRALSAEQGLVDAIPSPPRSPPPIAQANTSHQKKRASTQNLPPQLRASVFFQHESVAHELKIKRGSAMLTLDDFLDAAATAPAGEAPRLPIGERKHKTRRSTIASIGDALADHARARMSHMSKSSVDSKGHKRNKSKLSSNYSDEERDTLGPLGRTSSAPLPMFTDHPQQSSRRVFYGDNQLEEDEDEDEHEALDDADDYYDDDDDEDDDVNHGARRQQHDESDKEQSETHQEEHAETQDLPRPYAPPSTLLAELQLRKEELRSRNRTAAVAFPNGMRSTLLELDAVAQVEKRKRMNARTTLAWEDPSMSRQQQNRDDDDVPLGMLFPEKNSLAGKRGQEDWDRPLGLIQQRDMEDNEPLSRRRNRLQGHEPEKMRPHTSQLSQAVPTNGHAMEEEAASDHEGETLAQRHRRLKSLKALDDAIGGEEIRSRPVSKDFETEVLSQFGGLSDVAAPQEVETSQTPDLAEETLGQRRRRLQAEADAMANGQNVLPQTALRPSASLANLLAANPLMGARMASSGTKPPMAGLVGQSEQELASRRQHLYQQNQLSSSNLLGGPLVDLPAGVTANIGQKKRPVFAGGQFNDGTAGAGQRQTLLPRQSAMNMTESLMNPMPGMYQPQSQMQHAQLQQQMQMGMQPQMQMGGMPMSMPAMNMNMNMGMPHASMQMPQTGLSNNGVPSLYQQQLFYQQQNHRQTATAFPQMHIPEGYAAPGMYPSPGYNYNHAGNMGNSMMGMNTGMNAGQQASVASPTQRDAINRWRQTIMPLD